MRRRDARTGNGRADETGGRELELPHRLDHGPDVANRHRGERLCDLDGARGDLSKIPRPARTRTCQRLPAVRWADSTSTGWDGGPSEAPGGGRTSSASAAETGSCGTWTPAPTLSRPPADGLTVLAMLTAADLDACGVASNCLQQASRCPVPAAPAAKCVRQDGGPTLARPCPPSSRRRRTCRPPTGWQRPAPTPGSWARTR